MRRRIFRILLTLFGLLIVAAVAIQVILCTDLPQRLIIETLNKELGINVTAGSLRTSMWGKTTIRDFTISLPMEDSPFLSIPEMNLSHTALPFILFSGSFTLHSARIVNPIANIRENEAGFWNIQEFVYRLQQVATGREKQKKRRLPQLEIVNGVSVVTDSSGHVENVGSIFFQGEPQDQPIWNFEMNIASQIMVSGRVAEGSDWSHEVILDINDLPNFVKNLIPGSSEPLSVNTRWKGRIRENKLIGKLQLEQVQFSGLHTNGILGIEMSLSSLLIRFDDLLVRGLKVPPEEIRIFGGSVRFDGKELQADRILVDTAQSNASLTGRWNLVEEEGDFNGFWAGVITERNIDFESTWYGTIGWPRVGKKKVNLSITTQGESPWGNWQSEGKILGSGNKWSNSQWQVTVPHLIWQWRDTEIASKDIRAEVVVDWPDIKLVSLNSANTEQLKAEGEFSVDTYYWQISFEADDLRANERQSSPLDLRFIASGSREDIAVKEFRMVHKGLELEAAGKVALPSNELYDARANASWIVNPPSEAGEGFAHVSGSLQCDTAITGTVWPTNLKLQSVLSGQDITLNKKVIAAIRIPWQAEIDTGKVKYDTDQFQLFDGIWNLNGEYEFSQNSTQLALNANQVSLQSVIQLFNLPLECRGLMTANLEIKLPTYDVSQAAISGNWNVKDMVIPPIEADSGEGQIRIQNGTAVFDQIRLRRSQGLALAGAWFRLDQPQYVSVEVEAQQWPLYFLDNSMALVTDAKGNATLNLSKRTMKGKGNLSTSVTIDDKKLGHVSTEIAVEGRTIDLNDMRMETLGGLADGTAIIPLDNWLGSSAAVQWHEMDIGALAVYWSEFEGLAGKSSGSLTVAQAKGGRPLEPLRLEISGEVSDGDFRSATIGGYQISAYLGKKRLLIDHSELKTMNGTIKTSGSISRHAGGFSTYMNTNFSQLELNQLVHLFLPNAEPVLGRLTGKGILVVFSELNGMTGEANIQISESDLARTMVISTLYDTMNLKLGNNEPTGQGQIKLRFEGSSLKIPSFVYFNRGVEIRGGGTIDDLTQGKTSPVGGYAIGSIRPLKGTHLPGMGDLDRLMTSLQTGVSSVRIQGTLAEPEVVPVPLREIGEALRALLWRQLRE
jgi:hypothetical protein